MPRKKIKFLLDQSRRRVLLIKRIDRLTEKELELYSNNRAIKRYVSIQQLRDRYRRQLREIGHSIESVVESIESGNEMANHCVDVVCLGCGKTWCVRGCGYSHDKSEDRAKRARSNHALKPAYVHRGEMCCEGYEVVSDYVLSAS